ncbi:hypothetical protein GCM10022225_77760 [Plantactinospora mayteni]|uniref:Peptidylprolyl isomerase n=1 Tax=Plantactinospora mayteni TaxID=566021 RepID=A0ABQ4F2Y1_9ACTN|nr:hypothetical protein [Plantactinospora mayteni]GIH01210.1 hypothetical protein Pma05_77820 [Plantactinospora mayteni]
MTPFRIAFAAGAAMLPLLAACGANPNPTSGPEAGVTVSPAPQSSTEPDMARTRVRFTAGDGEIIVRIADNPTSRDFVSICCR